MKNCLNCKSDFEPYTRAVDCLNCRDGMEEYQYDYMMEPGYRICHTCKGSESIEFLEITFCSQECEEEWDYDQRMKSEYNI